MNDLRLVLRSIRRAPGFTTIAVLTLALGIGVNTALYTIVDQVLFQPLAFPEPDRLVSLVERSGQTVHAAANYENFLEWRARQNSFTALGAARPWNATLATADVVEPAAGAQVTHDYLAAAGVAPLRGRLFSPADDQAEAEPTIVISEALAQRLFGGSEPALGAKVAVRNQPYTVIGVLPQGFIQPTFDCAFWVPVTPFDRDYRNHTPRLPAPFLVLGRLKPGVTREAAQRDLATVARQLEIAQPATNRGASVVLLPFKNRLYGAARPTLLILLAAAGGVLLIACANLASLQLARTLGRQREFAVRAALGAGRLRIARLLLSESLVISLLGCLAGVLLAAWSIDAVGAYLPAYFPRSAPIALDVRALGFAAAAALLATLLSGIAPLWHLVRAHLWSGSNLAPRTPGPAGSRWQARLVVAQLAVTCLLLVGTGLMGRTLHRLYHTELGFSTSRVVSFSWAPALPDASRAELLKRAMDELAALPGVTQVGMISEMPLGGDYFTRPLSVQGMPPPEPGQQPEGASFSVSPGYFETMHMPVLRGRGFTARDNDPAAPLVAVIDTRLAERFFAGRDPIGQRIKFGTLNDRRPWVEVVGVVAHVENRGLGQTSGAQSYIPYLQRGAPPRLAIMVRTDGDASILAASITKTMRGLAPGFPIYSLATLGDRFASTIAPQRLAGLLLGAFAGLGLLLAAVGLYGVLTCQVVQRTREIGIRMALGARRRAVTGLVLIRCFRIVALGLLLGFGGAFVTSRFLLSLLYRTAPTDAGAYTLAAAVLLVVSLLACWLPARRATRVNPIEALRAE